MTWLDRFIHGEEFTTADGRRIDPQRVSFPKEDSMSDLIERCRLNLPLFLVSYLPDTFSLPFNRGRADGIRAIERAVLLNTENGASLDSGEGATSLLWGGAIWTLAFKHRRFLATLHFSREDADDFREAMITELVTNSRLRSEFSHLAISDRPRQRSGWLRTVGDEVVMFCEGILGSFRGLTTTTAEGSRIRPDLVFADSVVGDLDSISEERLRQRRLAELSHGLAGPNQRNGFVALESIDKRTR